MLCPSRNKLLQVLFRDVSSHKQLHFLFVFQFNNGFVDMHKEGTGRQGRGKEREGRNERTARRVGKIVGGGGGKVQTLT